MSNEKTLMHFMKGMALHDVAKPLYLPGREHTLLGYAILSALGRLGEALVALLHHGGDTVKENLKFHRECVESAEPLPCYWGLISSLDILASAAYSFMEKPLQKVQPEVQKCPASVQNPFSRLPLKVAELAASGESSNGQEALLRWDGRQWRADECFTVLSAEPGENPEQCEEDRASYRLNEVFRQDFGRRFFPEDWADVEKNLIRGALFARQVKQAAPLWDRLSRLNADGVMEALQSYMAVFGERTYPPMNDTSLAEHCRLSSALAFVLLANLQNASDELLRQTLDEGIASGFHKKLMAHADTKVVRVTFSGLNGLFENAARVDDLRGARQVMKELLTKHFMARMGEALGLDADLGQTLALAQEAFGTVYLLPGYYRDEEIRRLVRTAYDQAISDVVMAERGRPLQVIRDGFSDSLMADRDGLLATVRRDFDKVWRDNPSVWAELKLDVQGRAMMRQLQGYPIAVGISRVETPLQKTRLSKFSADFGVNLKEAYQEARDKATIVLGEAETVGPGMEVCDACGTHPVFQEFMAALPSEPSLRKVIHEFRGEPEGICLSCIGIRVMSHGLVEVPKLHRILQRDPQTQVVHVVESSSEDKFPDIPPLMSRMPQVVAEDDYVDFGAAFVRWRDNELQIYPTIGYAADADSNVALIQLTPRVTSLLSEYKLKNLLSWDATPQAPDWDDFNRGYLDVCRVVQGKVQDMMIEVSPHFARVLQRLKVVRNFFEGLQEDIEAAGIRALPIAVEYPSALIAVPTSRIVDAMAAIHESMLTRLLDSQLRLYAEDGDKTARLQGLQLLNELIPKLLYGAVVVFKHKQPLYVIMTAAQNIIEELDFLDREGKLGHWNGIVFGMADLRGVMSERELVQAQSPFFEAYQVVEMAREVDRRSLLSAVAMLKGEEPWEVEKLPEEGELPDIVGASLHLRGKRQRWDEETLGLLQENRYFKPVVFLKRMAR